MTYLVQKIAVLLFSYLSYELEVAHQVHFTTSNFEEQIWITIPLKGHDTMLVGCIYRSPTDMTSYSTTSLYVQFVQLSMQLFLSSNLWRFQLPKHRLGHHVI